MVIKGDAFDKSGKNFSSTSMDFIEAKVAFPFAVGLVIIKSFRNFWTTVKGKIDVVIGNEIKPFLIVVLKNSFPSTLTEISSEPSGLV